MAAKDFYHEHVKAALTKDGWTITDDPLKLEWLGTNLQIGLGAERLITAEKGKEKIAVNAKRKEIVKWISWTDIVTS